MIKVIQFLILGFAIVHFSEAQATISPKLKDIVKTDMSLSEFVDTAETLEPSKKLTFKKKVSLIKVFNQLDKNGDLEIDSYEYLTMN